MSDVVCPVRAVVVADKAVARVAAVKADNPIVKARAKNAAAAALPKAAMAAAATAVVTTPAHKTPHAAHVPPAPQTPRKANPPTPPSAVSGSGFPGDKNKHTELPCPSVSENEATTGPRCIQPLTKRGGTEAAIANGSNLESKYGMKVGLVDAYLNPPNFALNALFIPPFRLGQFSYCRFIASCWS